MNVPVRIAVLAALAGCTAAPAPPSQNIRDGENRGDPADSSDDPLLTDSAADGPSSTDSGDTGQPVLCPADWCAPDTPIAGTQESLEEFWDTYGGRDAFAQFSQDVVTALLLGEDEAARGDHEALRQRVDAVFARYPHSDPVWWTPSPSDDLNLGTPTAYYGLRMLEEIALLAPEPAEHSLLLTVVLADCASGTQPSDATLMSAVDVELALDPGVAADGYLAVRESAQLFQLYVHAITGGEFEVDLAVKHVPDCVDVTWSSEPNRAGVVAAADAVAQVPRTLAAATDMWWVVYPSNVPTGDDFAGVEFITGGMGGIGRSPLFIVDDLWLLRSPPHLGAGFYGPVERRVYLPQWMMHEFYHHLFRSWPEFGLEAASHQWFDRSTWPDDFEGAWEADYFTEAFRRRLAGASPSVAEVLSTAPSRSEAAELAAEAFVGRYLREPYENGYHGVDLSLDGDALRWTNDAGVSWLLSWSDGLLVSDPAGPYGEQLLGIDTARGPGGIQVSALWFNGEPYARQ